MAYNDTQIDRFSEEINFKGSILGYDQEQCLRYDLDVIDLMFFGWLEKFMANGKMKHREFDGNVYYNIHLDAFFRSMPICHVGKDAMKKRLAEYISKGLLEKKTVQTQKGKAVFIRFTDTYWTLSFDWESRKGMKIPVENSSQRDQNIHAQRDQNIHAQRDQNPLALNNPPVQYSTVQYPPPGGKGTEEAIKDSVCKLFDTTQFSSLMPDKFPRELIKACSQENILTAKDIQEYLVWIYELCKTKKPDNLIKYFYSVALKQFNIAEFIRQRHESQKKAEEAEKAQYITCPVCGKEHLRTEICPECGLENPYIPAEQVQELKLLHNLSEEDRNKLESELKKLYEKYQASNGLYDITAQGSLSELANLSKERKKIIRKYVMSMESVSG